MADYKSMYYHLAGRVAGAVDSLEASTATLRATIVSTSLALQESVDAFITLMEALKKAQRTTEEMFISGEDTETPEE